MLKAKGDNALDQARFIVYNSVIIMGSKERSRQKAAGSILLRKIGGELRWVAENAERRSLRSKSYRIKSAMGGFNG